MKKDLSKTIDEARALLRGEEKATLSTHSISKAGFPFGSVTTYMADFQGHPIIYISHLAQHTRNLKKDPKMSLLVSQENELDINAGARLTLLGEAKPVANGEVAAIGEAFYQRFPESKKYESAHDFTFYRLQVEHIRYIGGFGQIHWLPLDQFMLVDADWHAQVKGAIDHMNEDHVDAMQAIAAHYLKAGSKQVAMTHLFEDGFVLKLNDRHNHYIPFEQPIKVAKDMRLELVKMTRASRAALAEV